MLSLGRSLTDQVLRFYAFLGAVVAWIIHILVTYALVPVACAHGDLWIHLVTGLTLAAAAGSLLASWVLLRRTRGGESFGEETSAYLARLSLIMGPIFIFAIILQASAVFFISACDRTY